MSITKRGDSYQVSVYVGGKRRRKDVFSLEAAEALSKEWEAEAKGVPGRQARAVPAALQGKALPAYATADARPETLGQLVRAVCKKVWEVDYDTASRTRQRHDSVKRVRFAVQFFGENFPLSELDGTTADGDVGPGNAQVNLYVGHMEAAGNSGGTINRKLSALSVCLDYAADAARKWIRQAPSIERKLEGDHRIRTISSEEEAKALAYWRKLQAEDLEDLFIVLLDTGLRDAVEALVLKDTDVIAFPKPHVHVRKGKGAKERKVPLTQRAYDALKRRTRSAVLANRHTLFPFSYRVFMTRWDGLRTALKLTGDEQFVPHACRHTFCSRLADRNVPAQKIQALAGHSSIVTTMKYVHVSAGALFDSFDDVDTGEDATDNVTNVA